MREPDDKNVADDISERGLRPGRNCWRVEAADRFAFIVDAEDYFIAVRGDAEGAA